MAKQMYLVIVDYGAGTDISPECVFNNGVKATEYVQKLNDHTEKIESLLLKLKPWDNRYEDRRPFPNSKSFKTSDQHYNAGKAYNIKKESELTVLLEAEYAKELVDLHISAAKFAEDRYQMRDGTRSVITVPVND